MRKERDGGSLYSSQNTLTYDDYYKYNKEYPQTSHRERRFIKRKGASISDDPIDQVVHYKVRWKGGWGNSGHSKHERDKDDLIVDRWRNGDAVAQEESLEGHCSRPPLLLLLLLVV